MNKYILLIFVLLSAVLILTSVHAEKIKINSTNILADAYVKSDLVDTNSGSETELDVKWGTPKRVSYFARKFACFAIQS